LILLSDGIARRTTLALVAVASALKIRPVNDASIRQTAAELTARGIMPLRRGAWHPQTVARMIERATAM
jgi:hypothetical protein